MAKYKIVLKSNGKFIVTKRMFLGLWSIVEDYSDRFIHYDLEFNSYEEAQEYIDNMTDAKLHSKKLITLEDFNKSREGIHIYEQKQLNGIACPKCNNELYDTNPLIALASNPPRKSIHCEKCEYKGTRIV